MRGGGQAHEREGQVYPIGDCGETTYYVSVF